MWVGLLPLVKMDRVPKLINIQVFLLGIRLPQLELKIYKLLCVIFLLVYKIGIKQSEQPVVPAVELLVVVDYPNLFVALIFLAIHFDLAVMPKDVGLEPHPPPLKLEFVQVLAKIVNFGLHFDLLVAVNHLTLSTFLIFK